MARLERATKLREDCTLLVSCLLLRGGAGRRRVDGWVTPRKQTGSPELTAACGLQPHHFRTLSQPKPQPLESTALDKRRHQGLSLARVSNMAHSGPGGQSFAQRSPRTPELSACGERAESTMHPDHMERPGQCHKQASLERKGERPHVWHPLVHRTSHCWVEQRGGMQG